MKKIFPILSFVLVIAVLIGGCTPASPSAPAVPTAKATVTTSSEPTITPLSLAAQSPKTSIHTSDRILSFAIRPDQSSIAIGTIHSVFLYDLKTFKLLRSMPEKANSAIVNSLAWSPDGTKLAAGDLTNITHDSGLPHLLVWDTTSWNVIFEQSFKTGESSIPALAWAADNRSLAVSVPVNSVMVFNTETKQTISTQSEFSNAVSDLVWSPDGTRIIATNDMAKGLRRWKVSDDETVRLFDARLENAYRLAWSPDGKRVASAHFGGVLCLWAVASNQCETFIQAEPKSIYGLTWSPDGAKLATGGNSLRIWDAATGKLLSVFGADKNTTYLRIQWQANLPLVSIQSDASQDDATSIRLWDVETGKVLADFVK